MRGINRFIVITLLFFISFGYPTNSSALDFGVATTYPVGTSPSSVVVGDFNGDGKLDLAVANSGSGNVSILLGSGDGTFQAATNSPAGPSPVLLIAGDFNGDHKLDLIVLSYGDPSTNTAGAVVMLLGGGDGTFQAPVQVSTSQFPVSAEVGDFNGDGKLDLIVSDVGGTALSVFLGHGDGTFQAPSSFSLPTGASGAFAVVDVNNDTKTDLAIFVAAGIQFFLSKGDGTFQAFTTVNVALPPIRVQVADFNNDGKTDLLVSSSQSVSCRFGTCSESNLSLFLGNGDGSFQTEEVVSNDLILLAPVLLGDFNGDGKLDLGSPSSNGFTVELGKGDGSFSPSVVIEGVGSVLAVSDLNSDGNSDLVVAGSGDDIGVILNASPTTGADLGIIASGAGPDLLGVGTYLNYTANVLNEGPQDATNVTLTDTLPNGVSFVSATATQGSCTETLLVVTCNLGGLASAFSTQVFFVVTPTAPGTLTNTMSVKAKESDLAPANNFATQTTTVVPVYTLTVAKTGNGSGVVLAQPPGIDVTISCGSTCSAKYRSGTLVTVGASPDASSVLKNWSGACSDTSTPCSVTMDADKSVTANFVLGVALDFSVSPATAALTMHRGAQATDILTFTAPSGFSSSVALTCSVTGPSPVPSCGLAPPSVTPGANPATSTLTITAPMLAAVQKPLSTGHLSDSLCAAFLPIPGLALIGLGLRASKSKELSRPLWLLFILTLAFIALQVGCGGGSSSQPAPPVQTYSVTVTATTAATQHSTNITVTVQ